MNFRSKVLAGLMFVSSAGFSGATLAQTNNCPGTLSLPVATASNSVTFGDGISYSLPILGLTVQSSPGQISDCIVVATGANGVPVNTNFAGMDNAYQTPSGTSTGPSASPYFRTGDPTWSPDPGGAGQFVGDTATTWDTRLSALSTFLAGNDMVVYFNHNQINSGGAINQDLFVWAQIKLVDDAGVLPSLYFYVVAMPNVTGLDNFGIPGFNPLGFTGPQADPTCTYPTGPVAGAICPNGLDGSPLVLGDPSYMVRARGQVCLNGPVGIGTPIPCGSPGVVATVNENLGADQVANAVVFPEINAILRVAGFNGYDSLSADIRMGCNPQTISTGVCPVGSVLNNGYEQIFIARLATTQVPEPSSLALLGLGLLAAAGLGRTRRRTL